MDIQLEPDWYGYYGILAAAFAGMIGNHIMLAASRMYVWWRHPDELDVVQEEPPVALCMRASWIPRVMVPAILLGCFGLIIIMLQRPVTTLPTPPTPTPTSLNLLENTDGVLHPP